MMRVSVVIPVWNGEAVICACLTALWQHSQPILDEVICVDNASSDSSALKIRQQFPQVKLLQQSTNLGFAGGVNVGILAATGDLIILLNQDCIVQPQWLEHLTAAMSQQPQFAIAGCTILNADGSVNHSGAFLEKPRLFSIHQHEILSSQPSEVDYVTGAVFAIRRATIDQIGLLDDGFHPAYYEETDYCYRARKAGNQVGYVPLATVQHLFSSHEWLVDPVAHSTMLARSRYRFAVKHLTDEAIQHFLQAEETAVQNETAFEQAAGCAIAARQTINALPEIAKRVELDLGRILTEQTQNLWKNGFAQIQTRAIQQAMQLSDMHGRQLMRDQDDLLTKVYFQPQFRPQETEEMPVRWKRLFLRVLSLLSGRDYFLQRKLTFLTIQRLNQLEQRTRFLEGLRRFDES